MISRDINLHLLAKRLKLKLANVLVVSSAFPLMIPFLSDLEYAHVKASR